MFLWVYGKAGAGEVGPPTRSLTSEPVAGLFRLLIIVILLKKIHAMHDSTLLRLPILPRRMILQSVLYRTSGCSGNALRLYSGGIWFEILPALRFFMDFLSP